MSAETSSGPTQDQVEILEYNFNKVNKHPDPTTLCLIAAEAGLSEEETQVSPARSAPPSPDPGLPGPSRARRGAARLSPTCGRYRPHPGSPDAAALPPAPRRIPAIRLRAPLCAPSPSPGPFRFLTTTFLRASLRSPAGREERAFPAPARELRPRSTLAWLPPPPAAQFLPRAVSKTFRRGDLCAL